MTLNGISASSYTYATSGSAAVGGFQLNSGSTDTETTKVGSRPPRPPRMDGEAQKAALSKLQETDPALAQKMEEFHTKIDQMRQEGASQDDIQSTMKTNMDSLSDTEKSELKSIFGEPPAGGPRGPGGIGGPGKAGMEKVISSLKETNSELATKLESFNQAIDLLKESGASRETIEAKRKEQMESLSDTERDALKAAFEKSRPQQTSSAYSQSQAAYASQSSQSLAFCA